MFPCVFPVCAGVCDGRGGQDVRVPAQVAQGPQVEEAVVPRQGQGALHIQGHTGQHSHGGGLPCHVSHLRKLIANVMFS